MDIAVLVRVMETWLALESFTSEAGIFLYYVSTNERNATSSRIQVASQLARKYFKSDGIKSAMVFPPQRISPPMVEPPPPILSLSQSKVTTTIYQVEHNDICVSAGVHFRVLNNLYSSSIPVYYQSF